MLAELKVGAQQGLALGLLGLHQVANDLAGSAKEAARIEQAKDGHGFDIYFSKNQ
ncbi:MAG: hypothetical protein MZV70_17375 [Desulfobacterales bacterium]|nr:hypothetical protein [Desulfobacterales bacterium]